MIRRDQLGHDRSGPAGYGHYDDRRMIGEVESAGDDVAIRAYDQTGRWTYAPAYLWPTGRGRKAVRSTGSFDLDHARRDPRDRRLDSRLDERFFRLRLRLGVQKTG